MLTGNRVRLRARERTDLARVQNFNNNLAVELAGGGDPPMPQSLARLEAEFDADLGRGGRDGMGFVIDALDTAEQAGCACIGHCGLFNEDRVAGTVELGITIGDDDYWGKGYGREAVALLVDYAFRHHNFRKVWLRVHGRNQRATR